MTVLEHHKIVNVDVENNIDKYFVMQTLKCDGDKYLFVTRWGRTGTRGQAKVEGPLGTADEVAALLAAKLKEKTGNDVETV